MISKNPSNKPFPPRADGTREPTRRLAPVREACRYGNFGHTKCYEFINEGAIIAVKRGRQTLIDLDSIDAYHASLPRIEPKASAA